MTIAHFSMKYIYTSFQDFSNRTQTWKWKTNIPVVRTLIYFPNDLFDLKCQSDLLTLIAVQFDEWILLLASL